MRKYQITLGLFIAPLVFLVGFMKNTQHQSFLSAKPAGINNHVSSFADQPEVSIIDATTIQGDKGQTSFEVLVCLSQVAKEPVTMEYSTENGSAIAGADYIAAKGSIRFEPGETEKWVTVSIIGEVAADPDEDAPTVADVSFRIKLQKLINAIPKKINAIITIIKNIARDPRFAAGNKSVYEVHFSYTGYINVDGDVTNCPFIQRKGKATLYGYLSGNENVGRNDPVLYTGLMLLLINMDQCIAERLPNGDDKFCALNVKFVGDAMAELVIDEADRGSYIKFHHDTTKHIQYLKSAGGCITLNAAEKQLVPDNSIAAIFNGKELPMLIDISSGRPLKKLGVGVYSEKDDAGNLTVVKVFRKVR